MPKPIHLRTGQRAYARTYGLGLITDAKRRVRRYDWDKSVTIGFTPDYGPRAGKECRCNLEFVHPLTKAQTLAFQSLHGFEEPSLLTLRGYATDRILKGEKLRVIADRLKAAAVLLEASAELGGE